MVLMMMFLICLASQGAPVKSNTGIPLPQEEVSSHPRYRRDGTGSTPAEPEYVECVSITQDEAFQAVFRKPSILLPFLNEVLGKNLLNAIELTHVEVRAEEQDMYAEGQYHIFLDVRGRDTNGNAYVIEMERACQLYDVVRFQYTAARVFVQLINTRYKTLGEAAKKEAEKKTEKAKKIAKEAAKEKAEAENAKSQDVVKAMEVAAKAVREAKPKSIHNQDLFNPNDVPTVIVIVIVEKGMPVRKFQPKFPTEVYTLVTSFEKFGPESKMSFVYIDLNRFADTKKLENPETPLDHWCSFLWRAKDKRIEKKQLQKLQQIPGIHEAVKIIGNMSSLEKMKLEAKQNKEETLREEGRVEGRVERGLVVAKKLLKKKMDDATIIDLTEISADQLKELKSSL